MEGEEFEGKSQTAQKVYDSIIGEHWRVTIYLNVVGRHAPAGSADISSHVDVSHFRQLEKTGQTKFKPHIIYLIILDLTNFPDQKVYILFR